MYSTLLFTLLRPPLSYTKAAEDRAIKAEKRVTELENELKEAKKAKGRQRIMPTMVLITSQLQRQQNLPQLNLPRRRLSPSPLQPRVSADITCNLLRFYLLLFENLKFQLRSLPLLLLKVGIAIVVVFLIKKEIIRLKW